ncbi:DsbA family protein [Salmonella enterica]|uniref:Thiol:disulfide interchange protein n=1 Tax=Salmonella diarizonae TaxID=59204 RepID=A0A702D6A6_SALDZ|nr:DsbA family protein [Salmonella enterica]ECE6696408.1 thiol:disulfide interchange protein [Salmonella enterica subsp. diarizonae]EHG6070510.1 thioredoxin domain-containing protein [Salmonella enterica subsp. diarizonae serovar 61:z52:z53]EIG1170498.1 DsbA family protein [Salmonella enterica subsp. diarizonae serovar 48:k:z53]EKR1798103.1 DsbA family protein [Salmonella enterica subsp. diarizonae serovar 65:z10:e,n,x,z15]ASG86028.1 thiol:disulfide interchange protein [Salmonella enterica sub
MTMNYTRDLFSRRGILFPFLLLGCAGTVVAQEWASVTPPVADAPAVVEFFSFYCPPCYAFSQTMAVDQAIRRVLLEGDRMVKYHVSLLGPLGHELTRAWALAMVMNKTEVMEKAFFMAGMVEKRLHSPEDIRQVFMVTTGITGEAYDREIKSPAVNEAVTLQERLFREYGVRGTPSVYVRGRYHINNAAFNAFSVDDFRDRYASVVQTLLVGKDDAN